MNFHDNSYHACNEDIMYIFLSNVVEYLILSSFHSIYYYHLIIYINREIIITEVQVIIYTQF